MQVLGLDRTLDLLSMFLSLCVKGNKINQVCSHVESV